MAITFADMSSDNPFLPPRRRQTPYMGESAASLTPEQEEGLLGNMMEGGLGGLTYLGKVLDKTFGGRAVRTIAGKVTGVPDANWRELFSPLPFSDTFGLTNEQNVIHGTDLAEKWGWSNPNDTGIGATLRGLGVEVALDPAMWAGAAVPVATAKLLGRTGALAGRGVQAATGYNPAAFAARQFENAKVPFRNLFDTSSAGSAIGDVQTGIARPVFTPTLRDGQAAAEQYAANTNVDLSRFTQVIPGSQQVLNRAMYQAGEGLTNDATRTLQAAGFGPSEVADILAQAQASASRARTLRPVEQSEYLASRELDDLPDWARTANKEWEDAWKAHQASGNPVALFKPPHVLPEYQGVIDYVPRTRAEFPGSDMVGRTSGSHAGGASEFQIGREEFTKMYPGGTVALDDLARNPEFSGAARTLADQDAEQRLAATILGMRPYSVPLNHPVFDQAKKLSQFLKNLRPEAQQNGLFNLDYVGNILARDKDAARRFASSKAAMATARPVAAGGFVKPRAEFEAIGQPYVRVGDFLNDMSLTHTLPGETAPVSHEVVANLLGINTAKHANWREQLADFAIPKDVAIDVSRLGEAWTVPASLVPLVKVWDGFVNLFKGTLTAPFPAFHVRNSMSGMFNMWRDGIDPGTIAAIGKEMALVQRGGTLSPEVAARLFPGMAPEAATKELLKELIGGRISFVRGGQVGERVGNPPVMRSGIMAEDVPSVGNATLRPMSEDFGSLGQTLYGRGGENGSSWQRPFRELGEWAGLRPTAPGAERIALGDVLQNASELNPLVAAGRQLGNSVEDWVRGTHYLSKRFNGATQAEAKLSTMKYQIDYGDLTEFERNVMKRLFPWYTFSRKNLPPLLEDLVKNPAKVAGVTRGITGSRPEGEFVPPWIGEGSAVRLPGAPEGNMRFINSFGLPMEDEAIKTIGAAVQMDPRRFFQQVFGQMQPFFKVPAELATGTQMYSGRRLEELHPYEFSQWGGLLAPDTARNVSQVVANSPLSRFASSFDKLTDERKDLLLGMLNLGTGVRVTDVDLDRVKERAASDLLRQRLRGEPGVRSRDDVYVSRDQLPLLSQENLQLYDILKEIEQRQAARARQARAASQGLGQPLLR